MSAEEISRVKGLLRVTVPLLDEPLRTKVSKAAVALLDEALSPATMRMYLQRSDFYSMPSDIRGLLDELIALKAAEIAARHPQDPAEIWARLERRMTDAERRKDAAESAPSLALRSQVSDSSESEPPSSGRSRRVVEQRPLYAVPAWPNESWAVPNMILRSSLFAAIHGNQRKRFDGEQEWAGWGLKLRYRGVQLDQSDLDVWQMCLNLSRGSRPGSPIEFSDRTILRDMGRFGGTADRKWLATSLRRQEETHLVLADEEEVALFYDGPLVKKFWVDEASGRCQLTMHRDLYKLFQPGWTQISREVRFSLKSKPLALWLMGFCATHLVWRALKLSTIRELCGSSNTELRDFKRSLVTALNLLQEKEFISSHLVDEQGLVHIGLKRNVSQTQYMAAKTQRRKSANNARRT